MTFLPIVARELRVTSRRRRTYWTRFATALLAAGAALTFLLMPHDLHLGGQLGFCFLAFLIAKAAVVLSGNALESVCEERRDGTLGFLFLTDLKGYDVALGKLASNSVNSFYAILGVFPIVAVPLLAGGVSLEEVWKMGLASLNVFIFTHCAALLFSTFCRSQTAAGFLFVLAMSLGFGSVLLPPSLSAAHFNRLALLLLVLNPFYCLYAGCFSDVAAAIGIPGLAAGIPGYPLGHYWVSLALVHLLAWACFALASWWLPRCWQETARPVRLRWHERFSQWSYGTPATRKSRRERLVSINPFLWVISRNRLAPLALWSVLGLITIFFTFAFLNDPEQGFAPGALFFYHLILIAGVAFYISAQLGEQRHSGALEILLCATPLPASDILSAQWLALRRIFAAPLVVILTLDLLLIAWSVHLCRRSQDARDILCFTALTTIMFVIHIVAAGWVGMWRAMLQVTRRRSAVETVALLFFLPATVLVVVIYLFDFFAPDRLESFWFVQALWFGVYLAAAVILSTIAFRQLLTRFRPMLSAPQSKTLKTAPP